jgi:hypothetical protein
LGQRLAFTAARRGFAARAYRLGALKAPPRKKDAAVIESRPVQKPNVEDYLDLFNRYGKDFGDAYLEPEDERFRLLFDQLCRLLAQPSEFNLTLPEPFRTTAHRYLAGDAATVTHMRIVENRHFMLSDLFDYLRLRQRLGGKAG